MPDQEVDPLRAALHEATLAVLLGSTNVHMQNVDVNGVTSHYTVTIASAFADRLRDRSLRGDFDELLKQAMAQVDTASVANAIEGLLAKSFLEGLRQRNNTWDDHGWLQARAKEIAVEACTAALKDDEELLDILRTKIGSEVDRNRVGISVNLTDPEK